ncbi:hypothetical protein DIPPA_26610 [Diplonema papillatum]|nr:hypothetical protein DIPPA_26610 [Diplonema papillatum]
MMRRAVTGSPVSTGLRPAAAREQRRPAGMRPLQTASNTFFSDFSQRMKSLGDRVTSFGGAGGAARAADPRARALASSSDTTAVVKAVDELRTAIEDAKPAEDVANALQKVLLGLAAEYPPLASVTSQGVPASALGGILRKDDAFVDACEAIRRRSSESAADISEFLHTLALAAHRVDHPALAAVLMEALLNLNAVGCNDLPAGFLTGREQTQFLVRLAGHLNARGSHAEALSACQRAIEPPAAPTAAAASSTPATTHFVPAEAYTQSAFALAKLERYDEALEALSHLKTVKPLTYQARADADSIRQFVQRSLDDRLDPLLKAPDAELWVSLAALVKRVARVRSYAAYHPEKDTARLLLALARALHEETGRTVKLFTDFGVPIGAEGEVPDGVIVSDGPSAEGMMVERFRSEADAPVIVTCADEATLRLLNAVCAEKGLAANTFISPEVLWENHLERFLAGVESTPLRGSPAFHRKTAARHPLGGT